MGYVEQAPSPFVPEGVVPVNVMPMGPGGVGGGAPMAITRVYVGNLSWETEWQDLKDHMRSAGEVCVFVCGRWGVCFLVHKQRI